MPQNSTRFLALAVLLPLAAFSSVTVTEANAGCISGGIIGGVLGKKSGRGLAGAAAGAWACAGLRTQAQ